MTSVATRLITFLLQPIRYASYRVFAIQSHYRTYRRGTASFWGNDSFLAVAAEALEWLLTNDSVAATGIIRDHPFTFVQYPSHEVYVTSRLSTIDESFIQWGSAGILACVMYAFHVAQGGNRRWLLLGNSAKVNKVLAAARHQTASWLERHEMPAELVKSFRDGGDLLMAHSR